MKRRLCLVTALLLTGAVFYWNASLGLWYLHTMRPQENRSYYANRPFPDSEQCLVVADGLRAWADWAPPPGGRSQHQCERATPLDLWLGNYPSLEIGGTFAHLQTPPETPYIFGAWVAITLALLWPMSRQSLPAGLEGEIEGEPSHRRAGFEADGAWQRPYGAALMSRRGGGLP